MCWATIKRINWRFSSSEPSQMCSEDGRHSSMSFSRYANT